MDILLYPDIFIKFFTQSERFIAETLSKDCYNILTNKNNRILLSKEYIENLESMLEKSDNKDFFEPFLANLINEYSINVKVKNVSITFEQQIENLEIGYLNLPKREQRDFFLSFSATQESQNPKFLHIKIADKSKYLFTKMICEVAIYNPKIFTLRYSDVKNNKDLKDLFDSLFKMPNNLSHIEIYNRLLIENAILEERKRYYIYYYTNYEKTPSENTEKKISLLKQMNKGKVFFASKKLTHERRIMLGNFIIELDEDFDNISFDRFTWKIDFSYCVNTSISLREKNSQFKEL